MMAKEKELKGANSLAMILVNAFQVLKKRLVEKNNFGESASSVYASHVLKKQNEYIKTSPGELASPVYASLAVYVSLAMILVNALQILKKVKKLCLRCPLQNVFCKRHADFGECVLFHVQGP